jgi:hypothetical protein
LAIRARSGRRHMYTTFGIESNDSPTPGIIPQPVRMHDQPAARTAPPGERQPARPHFRDPAARTR